MNEETKILNHGDICNTIEMKLGLCDDSGDHIKSENTAFEVKFDETKETLVVTIQKLKGK